MNAGEHLMGAGPCVSAGKRLVAARMVAGAGAEVCVGNAGVGAGGRGSMSAGVRAGASTEVHPWVLQLSSLGFAICFRTAFTMVFSLPFFTPWFSMTFLIAFKGTAFFVAFFLFSCSILFIVTSLAFSARFSLALALIIA